MRRLLEGLARWYAVDLLSEDPEPDDSRLRACFPIRLLATLADDVPDRLLYWPGDDSAFAALTVQMLDAYPGVVVAGAVPFNILLQEAGGAAADVLQALLLEHYGWYAAAAVHESSAALERFPLDKAVAQRAVHWITDPAAEPAAMHMAIEQAYSAGPAGALENCLAGLTKQGLALPEVASALATTFCRPGRRQLLLDVSTIAAYDAGTGIQRVVRETVRQLGRMADLDARMEPVSTGPGGIVLAHGFGQRLFGLPPIEILPPSPTYGDGDVFVGLDLHIHDVDGLARHDPRECAPAAPGPRWSSLRSAAGADAGVLSGARAEHVSVLAARRSAVSRTVCCASPRRWPTICWYGSTPIHPPRSRPLGIGWFHLGADFRSAGCT